MIEAGEAAGTSRGRAREAIDYFLWAFTPLRPMTARDISTSWCRPTPSPRAGYI